MNVTIIITFTLCFNCHSGLRYSVSVEKQLMFGKICQFWHYGCAFHMLGREITIRERLKATFNRCPSLDLQAIKVLLMMWITLQRNWERLGQGEVGHWQRWDKAYFQEITAFQSTAQTTSRAHMTGQLPGIRMPNQASGLRRDEVRQSQNIQVCLLFSKGLFGAFQAIVKKSILLILLSCSPAT